MILALDIFCYIAIVGSVVLMIASIHRVVKGTNETCDTLEYADRVMADATHLIKENRWHPKTERAIEADKQHGAELLNTWLVSNGGIPPDSLDDNSPVRNHNPDVIVGWQEAQKAFFDDQWERGED